MFQNISYADQKQLLRLACSSSGVTGLLVTGHYNHTVYLMIVESSDGNHRGYTYRIVKNPTDPTMLKREVVKDEEARMLLSRQNRHSTAAIPRYVAEDLPAGFWLEQF